MLIKEAKSIVVSLSAPSKMPCKGYGLPALDACPVGKKLSKVKGSTCGDCYACKGMYTFKNVKKAQQARMESINNPLWAEAMVKLIGSDSHFRWHDSGDVFSLSYLKKILQVVSRTPETSHWLPTREKGLMSRYMAAGGFIPDNLTIRLSAAMIDSPAPTVDGLVSSTVHFNADPIGQPCPAPDNNGECGSCRLCWNKDVPNISYAKH